MTGVQLAHPTTGEVLTPESTTEDLARFLDSIREHESECRESKRVVTGWLLARMDHDASWTLHTSGLKVTGASPAPKEEWDAVELRERLLALVDDGTLGAAAVDAAVEPVVTYKVRVAGVKALRKLGGPAGKIVDELAREVQKDRYVSVSRA